MSTDRLLQAFFAESPAVFRSVASVSEVWRYDPFDVTFIHRPARLAFSQLVTAAATRHGPGRVLLLKGDSGAGKTHLLRAFRNMVHRDCKGVVTYTQMRSQLPDYHVFLLRGFIESLDQRYYEHAGATSGLMRLSNALARPEGAATEDAELVNATGAPDQEVFHQWADNLLAEPLFEGFSDADLLRALLYLQLDDAAMKARVLKYLRAEELPARDRALLGDMPSRHQPGGAEDLLKGLGRLSGLVGGGACVMCVDQLDEMKATPGEESVDFARAVETVCRLAEHVPHSVFVVAVVDDMYAALRPSLKKMYLDRLEMDPAPVKLEDSRTREEVESIVAKRLEYLFETQGVSQGADPVYPFKREELHALEGFRTRDVLEACRLAQEQARNNQSPPRIGHAAPRNEPISALSFDQAWSNWQKQTVDEAALADDALLGLMESALSAIQTELPMGVSLEIKRQDVGIWVEITGNGPAPRTCILALCNKAPAGGHLGKQLNRLIDGSVGSEPIALRSTKFPTSKGKTGEALDQFAKLGRCLVVENSEWRAMKNFTDFAKGHAAQEGFAQWRRQTRPMRGLACIGDILQLHEARVEPVSKPVTPHVAASEMAATPPASPDTLTLGVERGRNARPLHLQMQSFLRHAAFLGGSGSGKTTLALNIVEQLVVRGVPAILVDRKGDLCAFADDQAWKAETDSDRQRAVALRQQADIAVYTPGRPDGRGLSIAPIPRGLANMDAADRSQSIDFAVGALASMLNYRDSDKDNARRAALVSSLEILAADAKPSLNDLIALLLEKDRALLEKLGPLDSKVCDQVANSLKSLSINQRSMFAEDGDLLDIAQLFGKDSETPAGKTRVAIISTKFFADQKATQFWLTQFLIELSRYVSKNPSPVLQGTVFFDEADQYLPAVGTPPTKQPMENLLKRARSAGIGILLGTQSPGDLDYKCRDNVQTWFIGQVKEKTALSKLAWIGPDIDQLPRQKLGEFCVAAANEVRRFTGQLSVVQTKQQSEADIVAHARRSVRI